MRDNIKYIKPVDENSEKKISDRKKRKGKKGNKGKIIFCIILAILIVFIIAAWWFIDSKLNMIKGEQLNNNDLGLNNDIYDDIKDTVSKEQFEGVKTIALFGIDGGRSDTIIIASINPTNKSVKLISIPRDTYVSIDGYGKTKINHAYAYGKEQLALKTINNNFDLNIKEYVTVNFEGLINIINKVGGINLNITEAEKKYINDESQAHYKITGRTKKLVNGTGKVLLDGEQALTHARNRTVGNDFIRAERQRDVLNALIAKFSNMEFNKMLGSMDSILREVKTNIDVPSYIPFVTTLFTQKSEYMSNIISVQLPAAEYSRGQMINGVYYFTTDYTKAKADFLKYIYEK